MPQSPPPKPLNRKLFAVLIGCIALAVSFVALDAPGLTWDEPAYMGASEVHIEWLWSPSFSREGIDAGWKSNREHPPLAKVWIGAVRRAVRKLNPRVSELFASRVATALLFGGLAALVFLWASRFGNAAGFSAAIFTLLMPRLLAHARFAALDLPMAFIWFATSYAFYRAIESARWAAAAGVLLGAAMLTKVNAVFLPVPLVAWAVIFHRDKALRPCLMLAIGPLVFLAGWPWLWPNLLPRLHDFFFRTTMHRFIVPVYYFGKIYATRYAPWHYPLVLTLLTVPAGILACFGVGVWRTLKIRHGKSGDSDGNGDSRWLLVFNAATILLAASLPFSPKYDGVRLFLPLFPFVGCLAGIGFQHLWDWSAARFSKPSRFAAAGVFIALQAAGVAAYFPYETSYYNILCGGLPGAERIGLETTYWGDSVSIPVFEHLRKTARATGRLRVAFFPAGHLVKDIYLMEGLIDGDTIRYAEFGKEPFDVVVLVNRQGILHADERARRLFDEGEVVYEIKRMGVVLTRVVKNELR